MFGVVSVANRISRSKAATVAVSANTEPLVATITGSNTTGTARLSSRSATSAAMFADPSMPILIASAPMSERHESI